MSGDTQKLIGSWKRFNFDGQSAKLAEHVQRVAEYDELTKRKRATLVAKTKDFVKLAEAEKLEHLGPLVKEYQSAVDLLTKRSSASEQVVAEVQAALANVSDPAPALLEASTALAEIEALKAKVKRAEEQAKSFQKHILDSEQELMMARASGGGGAAAGVAAVAGGEGGGTAEIAALKEEVAKLKQENGRLKTVEADLMRTAAQLGEAKMQLAEMGGGAKAAVPKSSDEAAALKQQLAQLKTEMSDTNALLASMQQIADEAQAQLGEANAIRNELVSKCEKLTQELESKAALLESATDKSAKAEALFKTTIDDLVRQHEAAQKQATAELRQQLEKAEHARDAANAEHQQLRVKFAEATSAQAAEEAKHRAAEAKHAETVKALAHAAEEANRECGVLSAKLAAALQHQASTDKDKQTALERELQAAHAKYASAEQAHSAAVAELKRVHAAQQAEQESEISKLKAERNHFTVTIEQSLAAVEAARQVEATLGAEVDKLRREAEVLRAHPTDASEKADALARLHEAQMVEKDALIAQLKADKEHVATTIQQSLAAVDASRQKEVELGKEVEVLRHQVQQLQTHTRDSNEAAVLEKIEHALGIAAAAAAGQDVAGRQAAIVAHVTRHAAELKSLQSQVADLTSAQRSQQKAHELEVANLTGKHTQQKAAIEAELVDLKGRVEEMGVTNDMLKQKVLSVQKQFDELRVSADEKLDSSRSELLKVQNELAAAIARGGEANELRKKLEAANVQLEERNKALADMKQKSTIAVNQLREKNAQLTQKLSEISARDSESANEATAELKLQNAQLQSSLENVVQKMEEVQRQDELISAKNKELMTNIEFLQSEVSELRREAKANAGASPVPAQSNKEHAELQRQLEAERAKTAQLTARLGDLEKELERQNGRCEQAAQRAAHLEAELAKAASNAKDTVAQKEVQALQQRQRQLERDNRENLKLVETMQREKFETLELYTQCQKLSERQQKHVAALEQKIQRMEAASANANAHHNQLGVVAAGTALAWASWRKLGSCMQPLMALPTVQRVATLLRLTHKEKIDDPLDASFSEEGGRGDGGSSSNNGSNSNNDSNA